MWPAISKERLYRLIPFEGPYRHAEGNSDSHMKSVLVGASQTIFVEDGKLLLGRWQGTLLRIRWAT